MPAAADPVQEQFPTHTTVQEPYLGRNLELAAPLPRYFSSTPSLRREHDLANRLVLAVASGLQSKRWHLEIRTGCPVEGDGNVFVEGRALVRDSSGRLRAYAEASGTGDSAGVWKSYYDEAARLRAVFVRWANYMGHSAEAILRFDESGRIEGCSSPPDLQPPWACGRAEHGVDGVLIQWLRSIEPGRELGRCLVPYRPTE